MNASFQSAEQQAAPLRALVAADFVSQLGNQVAAVAVPILMLQYTGSPLVTALAAAAAVLPLVLAAFAGGRFIDRFGAWRASVVSDLLSMAGTLALPFAVLAFAAPPVWLLVALVFLGAMFDPTGVAARQTLVPAFARKAQKSLDTVNSLRGALENGADLAGPALAGLLIALLGASFTLFANAASFLFSALAFLLLVPRAFAPPHGRHEAHSPIGFAHIFATYYLRQLAVTGLLTGFVLAPFLALLLPILMVQTFQAPFALGFALSAFGLAATCGALAFAALAKRFSRSALLYGGLCLMGLCIALCGSADSSLGVILLVFVGGFILGAGNPLEQTVLQEHTPQAIAGQVFTRFGAVRYAAAPPALLIAGLLAEQVDVRVLLMVFGEVLIVGALACWLLLPVPGPGSMGQE